MSAKPINRLSEGVFNFWRKNSVSLYFANSKYGNLFCFVLFCTAATMSKNSCFVDLLSEGTFKPLRSWSQPLYIRNELKKIGGTLFEAFFFFYLSKESGFVSVFWRRNNPNQFVVKLETTPYKIELQGIGKPRKLLYWSI